MFIFPSLKKFNMTSTNDLRVLQIVNIVAFLSTVVMNVLANALPLNGKTTAELSDMYPNLFVPAGYVFAIWGVIYLLLLGFTVYQASKKQRQEEFLRRIGYYFALSAVANISWLFLWHYEQVLLSEVPMFVLLGSLIMIYIRLDVGRWERSREDRLLVSLPFSVYLGWITVAPIANVTAALVKLNWDGFGIGEATWTVLMIGIAVLLTGIVIYTRADIGYSLVIAWALGGIYAKQRAIPSISTASLIGIVAILGLLAAVRLGFLGQHRRSRGPSGIVEEMDQI
jgi:tryptophan-rich sensory protein